MSRQWKGAKLGVMCFLIHALVCNRAAEPTGDIQGKTGRLQHEVWALIGWMRSGSLILGLSFKHLT